MLCTVAKSMTKLQSAANYFALGFFLDSCVDDGGSAPVLLAKARCDFLRLVLGLLGQFSCYGPEAVAYFGFDRGVSSRPLCATAHWSGSPGNMAAEAEWATHSAETA